MRKFIFILFIAFNSFAFGHDTDQTYYHFLEGTDTVKVEVEFPWALRDALIHYEPELLHAKTRESFEKAFERYTRKNLVLLAGDGTPMIFLGFQTEQRPQSHHETYILMFSGNDLSRVNNQMLFSIAPEHINYNIISDSTYVTTIDLPEFEVATKNQEYLYVLAGLAVLVFGLLWFEKVA